MLDTENKLLTWTAIDQIAEAPNRLIGPAMRLMSLLKNEDDMAMTITQIVTKTKIKDAMLHEIVEHMPTVFGYNRGTTRIQLNLEHPPWDMSPAQLQRMEKNLEKNRAAQRRAEKQAEEDAKDTPFNNTFRRLEAIGVPPNNSKNLLRNLLRSNTYERIGLAIDAAQVKMPLSSPVGFILNWLKTTATNGGGPVRTVFMKGKPNLSGKTEFLGWENETKNGVRHKLYRRPDGSLVREMPHPDEHVPSIGEDAGLKVIA
jgi:hypothetical protein